MLNETPSAPSRQSLRLAVASALVLLAASAQAQYLGHNFPGDFGLMSGSQPSPGRYAGIFIPFYRSDTVKLEDGRQLGDQSGDLTVWGLAPLGYVVTEKKLLGGNFRRVYDVVMPGVHAPELLEPADKAEVGGPGVTLSWSVAKVRGLVAPTYECLLEVEKNSEFVELARHADLTDTDFEAKTLVKGRTYRWRVIAHSGRVAARTVRRTFTLR